MTIASSIQVILRHAAITLICVIIIAALICAMMIVVPFCYAAEFLSGILSGADEGSIINRRPNRKHYDRFTSPNSTLGDSVPRPPAIGRREMVSLKNLTGEQLGYFVGPETTIISGGLGKIPGGVISFAPSRRGSK